MKSFIKLFIMMLGVLFLLSACSGMKTAKVMPESDMNDLSSRFLSGEFASDLDGWVVLLDASSSMSEPYQGYQKFDTAKTFVARMAETLPPLSAVSGLRTFGHSPLLSKQDTQLFYGMSEFDRGQFLAGLNKVMQPGGTTPMAVAIKAAGQDLMQVEGNKAIIIVSDGKDLKNQPLMAAHKLQDEIGGNLCVYTVFVGDDAAGEILMEKIAQTSGCGFMVSAMDRIQADPMENYVTDVFLKKGMAQETVEVQETIEIQETAEVSPEKDTGLGYHKAQEMIKPLENVHFHFDQYRLTQAGKTILDKNITALNEYPSVKIMIEGYASAKGTEAYNLQLSHKRAESVGHYLTQVGGISEERISFVGYGESRPKMVEPHPEKALTPEALANMRVELKATEE
jgi:OOP family OmpA-OmpF porin